MDGDASLVSPVVDVVFPVAGRHLLLPLEQLSAMVGR